MATKLCSPIPVLFATLCWSSLATIPAPAVAQIAPGEYSDSEILKMTPPSHETGPRIYYINKDGMATQVDDKKSSKPFQKREILTKQDQASVTDDTVIIDGPARVTDEDRTLAQLGFRPGHAYYARRYHKYPWNYH